MFRFYSCVTIPESLPSRYGKIGPVPTGLTVRASARLSAKMDMIALCVYWFRMAPKAAGSTAAGVAAGVATGADRRVLGVSRLNCLIL